MNYKKAPIGVAQAFGLSVPANVTFEGYEPNNDSPKQKDGYVFRRDLLKDLAVFWESGLLALKLRGDPAAGKSSLVFEWHARLNAPLAAVSCSGGTQEYQLFGQLLPDLANAGALRWQDGPIVHAARTGTSVLLDEFNALDPSVTNKLNLILEGYPITIEETGERIVPKKGFRVYATENSIYSALSVTGRNAQDAASDDRWMLVEVGYMDADLEKSIVERAMIDKGAQVQLASATAQAIVAVANATRTAFRERFDDGLDPAKRELYSAIERPMSTRTAVRWALLTMSYKSVKNNGEQPLLYALPRAFASAHSAMASAVQTIARQVTGL